MDNQIETATKAATALIKAGAIQPVVGFFCFQLSVTFVEAAKGIALTDPSYWLCFGMAAATALLGLVAIGHFLVVHITMRARRD